MFVRRSWLLLAVCLSLSACSFRQPTNDYGVQGERRAYVPARIAILPCQIWPKEARFAGLTEANVPADEQASLCAQLEAFVLDGFRSQPYMRGFSPKVVERQLTQAGRQQLLQDPLQPWRSQATCKDCSSVPQFYQKIALPKEAWRLWLKNLSQTVKQADSVLLPMLLYARADLYDDRGLIVHKRSAGAALLLIDTESGELIWAGGRDAYATTQHLKNSRSDQSISFPSWDKVSKRLLTSDLWLDFPGRQL